MPPWIEVWVNALPDDEAVIAGGLRACAALRAPQEAMRITVHRPWDDLFDTAGRVEKRVPKIPNAANRALYGTDDFLDLANGVRALGGEAALVESPARRDAGRRHRDRASGAGIREQNP